ncbi:MAG: tetratricopeptide repeat protein [Prevotella sp.]|nr:tetratricopeptide repeat protein [Prevotella sp.]MBR1504963.1 tetratricopeptide repeat protein [Prevotella sp.]
MKYLYLTLCLLSCLSVQAYNDHRNARVDSLEAALKSSNPPKGEQLLRAYDELMRGYLPYDSAKASDYGRKALALSYELNGLNVRQDVIRRFAQMLYAREEYDEAVALYQQALAIVDTMATLKRYTEKDIDDARSVVYGSLGNVYNMQDKAHLAIHYYQLALPIFEKYDWKESQTILYYNIGELYGQMDNLDEAEHNYLKAIEKGVASGDSLMMAVPRKGLVGVYFNRGDYDQAIRTVNEVLAYYKAHRKEEPADYAYMLAMKARILLMEGHEDVAAAKTCVAEALPYIDSTEMMFDDAGTIYMAACEVAMAEKQWQKALDYGLKSVHPDSTATVADKGGYMLLTEIYTELGDKEKAREYMNKVYDMMSRYATDHYQSGLSQMEVLYETEKKEVQIAALNKERGLYRWLLIAAVVAIAALVTGTVLIVVVQRRKKALLAAKVALETETKERRILARDLHDGLGGMLSVLRMKTEQGEEVLPLIDSIHTELRRTAHHLIPEELLKNGLVSALRDFAVSVPNARFQAVGDILLGKDKELVLYRCAYELVNNTLKHAEATYINIQLMQDDKEITLTVSDNGRGMAAGNEGMGLQNIRERIDPYHGTLNIVTAEGKGTDINITLPL